MNLILPLQLHRPVDPSGRRDVRGRPGRAVVIQACDRRTPIIDQEAESILFDERRDADIDLLRQAILPKIDPSEIRSRKQPLQVLPLLHQLALDAFPFDQYRLLLLDRVERLFEIFVRGRVDRHFVPEASADLRCLTVQTLDHRLQFGYAGLQLGDHLAEPLLFLLPVFVVHVNVPRS